MTNGSYAVFAVIVVLVAGGLIYWFVIQSPANSPVVVSQPMIISTSTPPPTQTATNPAVAPSTVTVTYTDSGFSPATVTIPQGGTVIFKNAASVGVWVASDPHPLHNGYPTTGGCIGSTFDACKSIAPGDSWPFTFTFVGSWGYHDHLNPGAKGTVIVQ